MLMLQCSMATLKTAPTPLLSELRLLAATAHTSTELMTQIVEKLNFSMLRYNWVGFYRIGGNPGGERVLKLGPFAGTISCYAEIPLNRGVCGAVASTGQSILITDVASDPRYISRDSSTRSEVVVPLKVRGRVAGILDVNSHFAKAFTSDDLQLCENAAELVGKFMADHGE